MGTRGRKSAAQLAVAPQVVEIVPRPPAPDKLRDAQAEEWEAIVSRMPAEWFTRETHAALVQHCRHVDMADFIADLIGALREFVSKDIEGGEEPSMAILKVTDTLDKLGKMQARETEKILSAMTKMRITHQSSYTDKSSGTAKRNAGTGKRVWERS